jgi:NAD-reducing hydrogenase small subunit
MTRPTLATVWLDGCSGCHMSFLDMDERLLEIAARADLVYSPLVDVKEFPSAVDVTLVEGAVSSEDDLAKIRMVRAHTRILVSLGDCAVTANVPGLRNPFGPGPLLQRAYIDNVDLNAQLPDHGVPKLLAKSRPVHTIVDVDVFLPGCPPTADQIFWVIDELLSGRLPDTATMSRFGT